MLTIQLCIIIYFMVILYNHSIYCYSAQLILAKYRIMSNLIFLKIFRDLAGEKTPVNAILTKYARASTQNGIKYYSGKHAR